MDKKGFTNSALFWTLEGKSKAKEKGWHEEESATFFCINKAGVKRPVIFVTSFSTGNFTKNALSV